VATCRNRTFLLGILFKAHTNIGVGQAHPYLLFPAEGETTITYTFSDHCDGPGAAFFDVIVTQLKDLKMFSDN